MTLFQTDKILSLLKLFWQYPVITEKTFYQQNKDNEKYIGFPWATIIDKRYNLNVVFNLMKSYIRPNVQYFTCCQHISFRNLIPLFKALGIHTVYTPHKILNENKLDDIELMACPLYAVNVEDNHRNSSFKELEVDYLNKKRELLYSFQGAFNPKWYLTDIRTRIFKMTNPENCYVNKIENWHFEKVVYNIKQNNKYELNETDSDHDRTKKYNQLLLDSRYSLCPSGSGPNSIRFWESLAVGSIPVLLADTLELPPHELWDKAIVRIPEKKLEEMLLTTLSSISEDQEREMRENCMKLYKHFKDNYRNTHETLFYINISNELISPYFSVFGHFYLDHLFQLYKIKQWYNETHNTNIESLFIGNYTTLKDKSPFVNDFYISLFTNVYYKNIHQYNLIDIGVIMGSKINSETSNIYLAKSQININIPSNILTNGRNITDYNRLHINNMANEIKKKMIYDEIEIFDEKHVLIINRDKSPRKLINLHVLEQKLNLNGKICKVVSFDNMNLIDQIKMVYSYQTLIAACGSVQVHISFLNKRAKYIELCESGFRYPNTAIYGNYFNINTYNICLPLKNNMDYIRNKNANTKNLFLNGDKYPSVITNTIDDIIREKKYYSNIMTLGCFNIHMTQDIDCNYYIDNIIKLIK